MLKSLLLSLLILPVLACAQEVQPPRGGEPLPTVAVISTYCGEVVQLVLATPLAVKVVTSEDMKSVGKNLKDLTDKIGTPGYEVIQKMTVELNPGCMTS